MPGHLPRVATIAVHNEVSSVSQRSVQSFESEPKCCGADKATEKIGAENIVKARFFINFVKDAT